MSLTKKVLTSSSLLVGIKFFQRLVGLISILFLARLLTPEDFAIVALTAIVVHFFDMLSNAGSEQYIIQKGRVNEDDLNTAWTIDITMKSILWLILIAGSSFIATFFEQPELEMALYVSSAILIINAAKNPGLFLKKQNFEYRQIFWLSVVQRLVTFVIVIIIAYIERSYWALIIGDIISSLIYTIGSYIIDKHKVRLCFTQWNKQWNFSLWLLLKGIIGYTRSQIDTLIVSKFFPQAQLGQYYMARDIAMMPSHNLITPAIEPLLAAFKTSRNNLIELNEKDTFSIFILALVSIPMTFFISNFSEYIILILLGNQWSESSHLLQALSLLLFYFSFTQILEQCLIALKKVRQLFWYDVISLSLITVVLLLFKDTYPLATFAWMRGILGIIVMLGLFIYMKTVISIDLLKLIFKILPITISSLIALYATTNFPPIFSSPISILIQQIFLFFLSYLISLFLIFKLYSFKEINIIQSTLKREYSQVIHKIKK